jgi:hypothetical protein
MVNKPPLLFLLLMVSLSGFACLSFLETPIYTKWVIHKSSSLEVKGSTNVNTFSCIIPNYSAPDTLIISNAKNNLGAIPLTGEITLSTKSFDCHNPMMTAELRKILKGDQYPKFHIRFISLNKLPVLFSEKEIINGWVEIELANVTKRMEIDYQLSKDAQKNIHLTGNRVLNFTDFNIIPPRKLGGMIKTNNKLNIEFHLHLKTIN